MTEPYRMLRVKLWTDNKILRPSPKAEAKSRRIGTSKRIWLNRLEASLRRMDALR